MTLALWHLISVIIWHSFLLSNADFLPVLMLYYLVINLASLSFLSCAVLVDLNLSPPNKVKKEHHIV